MGLHGCQNLFILALVLASALWGRSQWVECLRPVIQVNQT